MNRFEYADSRFMLNEVYVRRDMVVRLYDGDTKVINKNGRYLWLKASISHSGTQKSVCYP